MARSRPQHLQVAAEEGQGLVAQQLRPVALVAQRQGAAVRQFRKRQDLLLSVFRKRRDLR